MRQSWRRKNHIKPLRQIWLPPLPKLLYLEDMKLTWDEKQMKLPIGLADDPQNQRQFPVYLDFIRDGHLLICGSAGSGKTSLVQTILLRCGPSLYGKTGELLYSRFFQPYHDCLCRTSPYRLYLYGGG